MARVTENQVLYETFDLFKNRCLIADSSLLWPNRQLWTLSNLQKWKETVIDSPLLDMESFKEKLEIQLGQANPELWGLTADLHLLPSFKGYHVGNALERFPVGIWEIHHHQLGIVHTGHKYHSRYAQLNLLVLFAIKVKEQHDRLAYLQDAQRVQKALDEILEAIPNKVERAYDMRHAILYLMFPDK